MIWRFALASFLTVALSWFCLSERTYAQFNGCPAGFCSPSTPGGSCSAVLALDGSATANYTGGTNTYTITLSTSDANDVIIVGAFANNTPNAITGVSSSNVVWDGAARGTALTASGNTLTQWRGVASSALTSEVITLTFASTTTFSTAAAFGINGANTSSSFDSNGALPATTTTTTPPSVSTSNLNDFIYSFAVENNNAGSAGSGFTGIQFSNFIGTQYKIVSTTQSGLSMAITGDTYQIGVGDAVKRSC